MRAFRRLAFCAGLLTALTGPSSATTLTWTGAFSNSWKFNGGFPVSNWGGFVPGGGDDVLVFPSNGANKTMLNDLIGAASKAVQLRFTGAGYILQGNDLELARDLATGTDAEIAVTHGAGTTAVEINILASSLKISVPDAAAVLQLKREMTISGGTFITGMGTVETGFIVDADFSGSFTVGTGSDAPVLVADGNFAGNMTVRDGATLAGHGSAGSSPSSVATIEGIVAPGDPAGGPFGTDKFTVVGDVHFASTAVLRCELDPVNFSDKLVVSGDVVANSAVVELVPLRGFPIGTGFALIQNEGPNHIDNTPPFRLPNGAPINEGTEVNVGVNRFKFSYAGNGLSVTVVAAPFSGTREWDAGGTTRLMSEAANWSSNALPVSSNTLRFGTLAPSLPLGERFPINDLGGNFFKLEFTAGGYAIEESEVSALKDLTLVGGIEASHTSDGINLDQDLFLAADQTFGLTGTGFIRFGLNNTVDNKGFDLTAHNASTGEYRFNGRIAGAGKLIKTGSGFVLMSSSSTSTYTGGTLVSEGELRLSRTSLNGAVPGTDLTIGGAGAAARVTTTATEQIADAAVVTVLSQGSLEPGALETIGGLVLNGGNVSGAGVLAMAGNILAVQNASISAPVQINGAVRDVSVSAGRQLQMSGPLTVSPASTGVTLRKVGEGTLVLSSTAANTTLAMEAGELRMNGTSPNTLSVSLRGGTLGGTGRLHELIGSPGGGDVSPGIPGATTLESVDALGCARLSLNASNRMVMDIAGNAPGVSYDLLTVTSGTSTGQVALNSAQLVLRQTASLPVGTALLILDNDGTDAITGTFAGLPQGALVSSPRNTYTISYTGGTGNDVTLTAVSAPEISVELNSSSLADGTENVFFATIPVQSSLSLTFTIRNIGTATLSLTGSPRVQVSGTDAQAFTVTTQPAATVAAGGSTTFTVRFTPTFGGSKQAQLIIPCNDGDENPFNIPVFGGGIPVPVITSHTTTRPSGGNPGTVNLTAAGSNANATMRLEASSNLSSWTLLKTVTTDSVGGVVTGVTNDPGSLSSPRRFYRLVLP